MSTDNQQTPARVLVLDSGVGALSIIDNIRQQLPAVAISYASDNGFFPYGTKPEALLVERVHQLMERLISETQADIAVVACNTASTVALPRVRQYFSLPIVGVVPAIKPAGELSTTRVIGLLATPGTINRQYTQELIRQYAADCEILPLGSSELVSLAERKLMGIAPTAEQIQQCLTPLLNHPQIDKMDTLVLACTHFPLLKDELSGWFDPRVQWLDSGKAIANRVAYLLETHQLKRPGTPQHQSFFTADTQPARQLAEHLGDYLPGTIRFLNIEN